MMVDVEGPGGVKPEVMLQVKDGIMECTYHCKNEGDYIFSVMFDEEHVEGSPFTVKVEGEFLIPVEKVVITGTGIKEGRKGQFNEINIDPRDSGITCKCISKNHLFFRTKKTKIVEHNKLKIE